MKVNKKIEILCLGYKEKTENMFRLLTENVCGKIIKSRKLFERRLRRRLVQCAENFEVNLINYVQNNLTLGLQRKKPKIWMKKRSKNWWSNIINSNQFDEWIENFRVDKSTFEYLCEKLKNELEPKPNCVRQPLDVKIKVAIALYKLSSCSEYRVVANQFGVHKTSVYRSLKQFCHAVVKILLPEEIKLPTVEEAMTICNLFEEKSGIPLVLGAIDGCHIPVTPPLIGYRDYINRKNWPSVVLQGLVDANYGFLDITVKHPGCTHDATVLKDSYLFMNIDNYQRPSKFINNEEIEAFVIGDPAYPLLKWLIKGYATPKDPEEESFNVYLNKARIVVENTFGRLKSRWRMLQKKSMPT